MSNQWGKENEKQTNQFQQPQNTSNYQQGYVPLAFSAPQKPIATRSKATLIIVAIFLGCIGGHYFFLGDMGKGIKTLLLGFITCGLFGVFSGISTIIKVVSGSLTTDVRGVPIK